MTEQKYRAPALEKGLEILELLGRQTGPMPLSEIASVLDKSRNEIFRMVRALESTGYIRQVEGGEGFEITNKLFLLGLEQPRMTTLLEAALPVMRDFSTQTRQSCHISIASDELMVVIARIDASGPVSFAVRAGHRQLLSTSASGLVLYAWQAPDEQDLWNKKLKAVDKNFKAPSFLEQSRKCVKRGYLRAACQFVGGVTDIAAPILSGGKAIAALSAPCIKRIDAGTKQDLPVETLISAAKTISSRVSPVV